LAEINAGLPSHIRLRKVVDRSTFIRESVEDVQTTLVLGGLMSDNTTKGYTKVPLMGDIPGVGFFFRSKSKQLFMKNLIIFITPTIVTADAFRPTKTDFLNSTVEDRPYKESGAWDSAKPYDWSKSNAASKEEATFNESAGASKKPAVPAPKNP